MNLSKLLMTAIALVLMLAAVGSAQTDVFGKVDTLYADVAKVNDQVWTVTVKYVNDEAIKGMSVPFKLGAGTTKVLADSVVYTGGRVENFDLIKARPDTAIQCITLGIVGSLGPQKKSLPPGSGRLATIFVSSMNGEPIDKLIVDTTTTSPSNSLMAVADESELGRMLKVENPTPLDKRIEIFPAFVVRYTE